MLRLKPYAPYRDFRRGCASCFILLLLLLLLMLILSCLLGLALSRWLTPTANAASDGERQTVLLAPGISAVPYRASPYGVFFSNRVNVNIAPGVVLLSSTPDGNGQIMTDDQVIIQVIHADGSRSEWSHDFRASNSPGVAPLPAQNITALFQLGANEVTIVLIELMPNTYSSLPYYLIFTAQPILPPTKILTASPSSTSTTVAKTPSPTPTRVNSTNAGIIISATPTKIVLPTAISPTLSPTPVLSMVNTDASIQPDLTYQVVLGGGILLAGIVMLLLLRSRRAHRTPANPSTSLGMPAALFG